MFFVNVLSNFIFKGNSFFDLLCISRFCQIQLATTEKRIIQKAIIESLFGVEKSTCLKNKYTTGIRIAICESLTVIKEILNHFIFQKICKGNCCIPANIKLAENIIPKGSHRIMY